MVGEDVEDDRRAVDHGRAERLLEIALLAGQQLVVACDEVCVGLGDRALELCELALAEVAVGVGRGALLGHLAGHGHARRAEQLAQLRQVGLIGPGGYEEGTLACAGCTDGGICHYHECRVAA